MLAAFRSSNVGGDTASYILHYETMSAISFSQVADYQKSYLGYFYPSKIFSWIGMPCFVWFGFVEGLYVYTLNKFIKKYSQDRIYSVLVFLTNGLYAFSVAGNKQVMSMSLMLLAFLFLTEKKYIRMILAALWGAACHSAGLIFLLAFVLYYFRNIKYFIFIVLGISVTIVISSQTFLRQLLVILAAAKEDSSGHFEMYTDLDTSYTPVTLFFYIGSIIMALFFIGGYLRKFKDEAAFVYGMCFIACAMQSLASINPSLFRMALPFAPFFMLLLPNTAYTIKDRKKRLLFNYAIWIWHISYFLITTNEPYEFM